MSALCCACGKDRKDKNPSCVWCLFHDSLQIDCPDEPNHTNAQQRPSPEEQMRSARLEARKTSIT